MKRKILIVPGPDHEAWSHLDAYLARQRSLEVSRASSSSDLLRVLKSDDPGVILLDYDLPRVNPVRLLRRIKDLQPHVEVIFFASRVTFPKAVEAIREGAYDFYEFPANARLVMAVIEKAFEKQELFFEKQTLEETVRERFDFGNFVGRSKGIQHVLRLVRSIAPKNVNVLITGETGTGKELVADMIHYNSPRAGKPYVKVNCAVFNEGVLESELFGHERGAFTGAISQRVGRFELANGGTIFLDEIGDVSMSTQIKLLRVLQEREFERVGSSETIKVDVRVIAATNQDLRRLIEEKRFREDLFYRLNVVHIETPPLRERKSDIPLLVSHFVNRLNEEKGYQIKGISKQAMRILSGYNWPGNVRELENALESAVALTDGRTIEENVLPSLMLLSAEQDMNFYHIPRGLTLGEVEDEIIRMTLAQTRGNRTKAAKILGIGLRTLQRKLKESDE